MAAFMVQLAELAAGVGVEVVHPPDV